MPWRFNPFTGNLDETDIPAFNGEVTLGSAASPSLYFTGDPNTGIYSPGADQLALSTSGTGRLFIDSSGNVGINDSSPSTTGLFVAKFTYNRYFALSESSKIISRYDDNSAIENVNFTNLGCTAAGHGSLLRFNIGDNSNVADSIGVIGYLRESDNNGFMFFKTNDAERLRITSDGKVGLGTSSPIYPFDCNGQAGFDLFNVSGGGAVINLRTSLGDANKYNMSISSYDHSGNGTSNADGLSINGFDGVSICTGSSTARQERLRVTEAGLVGVGTTSPTAKLTVNGTAVMARFQSGAASDGRIEFAYNTTDIGYINAAAADRLGLIARSGVDLQLGAGGSEAARIDSSGRLLVGTSSDSGGALLQVNDNRIRIATAKTPASASDTGTTGEVCWDASYIYVCTATDTWKRAALSTW